MECATFHILTRIGHALFRQMEAEAFAASNWTLRHRACFFVRTDEFDELLLGYDWLYRRLFSHTSIWRRRPREWGAVLTYWQACYLQTLESLWHFLIKRGWCGAYGGLWLKYAAATLEISQELLSTFLSHRKTGRQRAGLIPAGCEMAHRGTANGGGDRRWSAPVPKQ